MTSSPAGWSEERFARWLGLVLRTGVLLSASLVAGGGVLYLRQHEGLAPDYQTFRLEGPELRSMQAIVEDVDLHSGRGLIQLGVLALIVTPVARVVFAALGFLAQRDWLYAGVSLLVLFLLAYSLTAG